MKSENYDSIYKLEKDNWWYASKRNLFSKIINSFDKKFKNSLDIGCGVGSNLEILKKFSKSVVGIDNSKKAIDYCKHKGLKNVSVMNASKLKFKKDSFDLILCSDILEHVDDKNVMEEVFRVLKPGGIFICSVPAHNYLWGPTDRISNHLRRYEKKELNNLFKNNFTKLKLSYWNFFMFLPNFLFTKISINKKNYSKNSLELIPKFLNNIFYRLLLIENNLFFKIKIPQGVSLIGIYEKNETTKHS